jgi:hypothetical protein
MDMMKRSCRRREVAKWHKCVARDFLVLAVLEISCRYAGIHHHSWTLKMLCAILTAVLVLCAAYHGWTGTFGIVRELERTVVPPMGVSACTHPVGSLQRTLAPPCREITLA